MTLSDVVLEVAVELRNSPQWVMKNFTYPQLGLMYQKIKQLKFDFAELQARLVWAIANGWKKPQEGTSGIEALKGLGSMYEEQ